MKSMETGRDSERGMRQRAYRIPQEQPQKRHDTFPASVVTETRLLPEKQVLRETYPFRGPTWMVIFNPFLIIHNFLNNIYFVHSALRTLCKPPESRKTAQVVDFQSLFPVHKNWEKKV